MVRANLLMDYLVYTSLVNKPSKPNNHCVTSHDDNQGCSSAGWVVTAAGSRRAARISCRSPPQIIRRCAGTCVSSPRKLPPVCDGGRIQSIKIPRASLPRTTSRTTFSNLLPIGINNRHFNLLRLIIIRSLERRLGRTKVSAIGCCTALLLFRTRRIQSVRGRRRRR